MKTDDLIALISADSQTARRSSDRQRLLARAALIAAILLSAVVFLAGMGLRDGLSDPAVRNAVLRKELVAILAALAGVWLAARQMRPDAARSRLWLLPLAACAGLAIWDVAAIGPAGWASRMIGRNGLFCLMMIPLLSLMPLAALLANLKGGATTQPAQAGAWAGLGAAGIGAGLYALHCTDDSMLFVLFWYVPAALLLALAGAVAGRLWLRW